MSELPEQPHLSVQGPPEHEGHGYWGPLPGESVELYRRLGVPFVYENIQPHFPRALRGEFDLQKGVATRVDFLGRDLPQPAPPETPTRQERIEAMIHFTKTNEKIHLGALAVFGAVGGAFLSRGGTADLVCGALVEASNVAFNVYPIMLQRYMRLRGYRILEATRRREGSG